MDYRQLTFPSIHPVSTIKAKPFLKWAGGKTQLLPQFRKFYPPQLVTGDIKKYVEPFVGGGAVFFDIVQKYSPATAYLSDITPELITVYKVIQQHAEILIEQLRNIEHQYKKLTPAQQKDYFYQTRQRFNRQKQNILPNRLTISVISSTAMLVFLNRTCFNGLFRLNQKGSFNVPFGSYKNPTILNAENIFAASQCLQNTEIHYGDFEKSEMAVDDKTFVYFDPPYRPISQTASFTSYSKYPFQDQEQIRLAKFFQKLDQQGAKLMLSNSDPTNENSADTFFHDLYRDYQIHTVMANRMINRDGTKRNKIRELVITNYEADYNEKY